MSPKIIFLMVVPNSVLFWILSSMQFQTFFSFFVTLGDWRSAEAWSLRFRICFLRLKIYLRVSPDEITAFQKMESKINQAWVESVVLAGDNKFKLLDCDDLKVFGIVFVICFGIFDFASTIVGKPEFFMPESFFCEMLLIEVVLPPW